MDIVLYPDPRLRAKNAPVTDFDDQLAANAKAMFKLMYETVGVGLAAPQVGLNLRLMVFNPAGSPDKAEQEVVLCNPKLVWKSKEKEPGEEGCLSFPEVRGQVLRPIGVKVIAQDLQGKEIELQLQDWEARIFQHELDHLEGVLFVDRMSPASKSLMKSNLEELVRQYREELAGS